MSEIKDWSTTDAENTSPTKSGMPEGMLRSDVNNRVREHLGAIRRWYEDAEWVDLVSGHNANFTYTRVNDTTLRITDVAGGGTNATSKFPVGSWLRIDQSITGNRFGSIVSVSYSAPNLDIVLTEVVDSSYSSAGAAGTLTANVVNSVEIYTGRRVRSAAFSKVGNTPGQSPGEIPTIDLLKGHVLKDEGEGGGIDADLLDGQHKAYFVDRDLEQHGNSLSNGEFTTWSRGTSITLATTHTNADGNFVADDWRLLSDGSDMFDVSRQAAGNADFGLKEFDYSLELLATGANNKKGGIVQILTSSRSRAIVQNGKACLSFYARTATGDSIANLNCAILYSTAAGQPTDVVSGVDWGAEGAEPAWTAGWTRAGTSADNFTVVADVWNRFELDGDGAGISIPATAIDIAAFIWIDDTSYNNADIVRIAGAQLEIGTEVSPFRHSSGLVPDAYRSGNITGDGTYWESTPTAIEANATYGPRGNEAHSLGTKPRLVQGIFRCKDTEHNWAVGTEFPSEDVTGTYYYDTYQTAFTDSHFYWSHPYNNPYVWDKDAAETSVMLQTTTGKWEFFVRAWK